MEIDRTFIILVIGFSVLGGLTLLCYSADAIKLQLRQMAFMEEEKKRAHQQHAAQLAAMERQATKES